MRNLEATYLKWIAKGRLTSLELEVPFTSDCGERSAREDFSNFANLDKEITFEEMSELEEGYLEEIRDIEYNTTLSELDALIIRDTTHLTLDDIKVINPLNIYNTNITEKFYISTVFMDNNWECYNFSREFGEAISDIHDYCSKNSEKVFEFIEDTHIVLENIWENNIIILPNI